MATNKVLIAQGGTVADEKQISFADHAGDFSATAANVIEVGAPRDVDLALASLADGAGVNSDQVDLGATRAARYSVDAALEFAATPTAGEVVELYWSPSANSTVSAGNPGNPDGVDGSYTGDGGGTLAESVLQMQHIGDFVCTDLETSGGVQIAHVGIFSPAQRYGQLIVKNASGAAIHSDDVECNIVFTPMTDDIQAAV